jgi:hypothetical protein
MSTVFIAAPYGHAAGRSDLRTSPSPSDAREPVSQAPSAGDAGLDLEWVTVGAITRALVLAVEHQRWAIAEVVAAELRRRSAGASTADVVDLASRKGLAEAVGPDSRYFG